MLLFQCLIFSDFLLKYAVVLDLLAKEVVSVLDVYNVLELAHVLFMPDHLAEILVLLPVLLIIQYGLLLF